MLEQITLGLRRDIIAELKSTKKLPRDAEKAVETLEDNEEGEFAQIFLRRIRVRAEGVHHLQRGPLAIKPEEGQKGEKKRKKKKLKK